MDPTLDLDREVRELDATEAADTSPLTAIAGARELVSRLAPDHWAIVTSGGYGLASRRLDRAGIPHPAVFVTAEAVQRGKPDPQGYLLAAQRLGRPPASCIVFEDAPPGIAAGRAAGARVIGLTTTHTADQLLDTTAIVPDFTAVHVELGAPGLVVRFDP